MVATNTQAPQADQVPPPTRTPAEVELHDRLVRILDGGPAAIDERLRELEDASANAVAPTLSSAVIAGGEKILQKLFGARFAAKSAGPADPLDLERERIALRALRGDFQNLPTVHQIEDRHALLRMEGEGGIAADPDDAKHDHASAVEAVMTVTGK